MKKRIYLLLVLASASMSAQVPAGAVGYWPFDNNAPDYSGNGNNGVVSGATPAPDRFGNANMAYKFDGSTSKITVPNSTSIDMGPNDDFTIALWEKAYPNSNSSAIITKHTSGTWNGYNFIANNSADPGYCTLTNHIYFYTASGAQQDACSNTDLLKDSTWHFLLGTFKAATQQNFFYIDGVLQADSGGSSGTMSNPSDLSFGFDVNLNAGFFNGVLDGGRIYKRALNQTEILQLYNEGNKTTNPGGEDGINELKNSGLNVSLYPNPTDGLFSVSASEQNMSLEVFSSLGIRMLSQQITAGTTTIDLKAFVNGFYYVKIQSSGKQALFKLAKE